MTKSFREKWLAAVEQKNSVLCAGLDPAEYDLGRGEEGLPYMIDKKEWSYNYVHSIGPFSAALKLNINYWKNQDDMCTTEDLADLAAAGCGMASVDDSKLTDTSSSNEAGIFYAKFRGFDAVTLAPFAGNMAEAAEQARKWGIGLLSICLMSDPEYEREKNALIPVRKDDSYREKDIEMIGNFPHVKKYIQLAHDAAKYGLDGIVIGAPSKKNHISEEEIAKVRSYVSDEMLVLLPGIGAQGGEAEVIWKYFNKNNVIVNVGRALMFSKGSKSSPADQADAAKYYQEMLNQLRKA